MFETDDFKRLLEGTVSGEAARNGLAKYQTYIATYFQDLAVRNEPELMPQEFRKAASERRGIDDALRSAVELTKLASQYALAARRDTLELQDMQRAYQERFCRVWPFCK